jgi:glycosyltransferase involved in cell wall biosynthesis
MNRIKVLYIVDSYTSPYAGTEGQLHKLISNLDRDKYEPHLLMFNASQFISDNGFPCDVTVLGSSKLSSLNTWVSLSKFLKQKKHEGFALAHIFFNDPSIIAPPLLKLFGFKTIISRRDMGYWYTPAYLALLRFNARLIDYVIVNSEAVKNITCEKEWINRLKIGVIYNGYEHKAINPAECVSLKQEYDEVVLGLVANIRPIKRMQDAIQATANLNDDGLNVRLVIVGAGDPTDLKALAKSLNIQHKVDFAGSQQNVSRYIQGFDVCLLNSESEGFSNAIIEYMQHGKPVVCSAVGGNPEIIDDREVGYLYPMGDVGILTSRLEVLCKSVECREQFGQKAQLKVTSSYSISNMLKQHEMIYRNLVR